MIEESLNEFMKNAEIDAAELVDALKRVKEMEVDLYSIDYVLATCEYQDFYDLIMQHKVKECLLRILLIMNLIVKL
jgi:hypothetical protein